MQRLYSVYYTTNLMGAQTWLATSFSNQPGSGAMMAYTNESGAQRCFRLLVKPQP